MLPILDLLKRTNSTEIATQEASLNIPKIKVTKFLFLCVALFFCGHLVDAIVTSENSIRIMTLGFWTGLDTERNIPTLFSTLLLFSSSCLLGINSYIAKFLQQRRVGYWILLSFIFLLLAFDEAFSFHERLGEFVSPVLDKYGVGGGLFYFSWVVPGMLFVGVVFLIFLRFLKSLPMQFRHAFLLSGFVYICGAIGIEMFGGAWDERFGRNFIYSLFVGFEEGLEMCGIIIFIHTLLSYLQAQVKQVKITIQD
jgi:hypothetical protein